MWSVKEDKDMKSLITEKNTVILGMLCALIGGSAYGASQFMFKQVFKQNIDPLVAVSYALLSGTIITWKAETGKLIGSKALFVVIDMNVTNCYYYLLLLGGIVEVDFDSLMRQCLNRAVPDSSVFINDCVYI